MFYRGDFFNYDFLPDWRCVNTGAYDTSGRGEVALLVADVKGASNALGGVPVS